MTPADLGAAIRAGHRASTACTVTDIRQGDLRVPPSDLRADIRISRPLV